MSAPRRFRKRPVQIEAMQWDGTNEVALIDWTDGAFMAVAPEDRGDDLDVTADLFVAANSRWLPITTGEWVLRDALGFYPCKPDIFDATYEAVTS